MSVPHGKNVLHEDFISVEMMYRIAPPMKLPMPTMNIDFSIFIYLLFANGRLFWNQSKIMPHVFLNL